MSDIRFRVLTLTAKGEEAVRRYRQEKDYTPPVVPPKPKEYRKIKTLRLPLRMVRKGDVIIDHIYREGKRGPQVRHRTVVRITITTSRCILRFDDGTVESGEPTQEMQIRPRGGVESSE